MGVTKMKLLWALLMLTSFLGGMVLNSALIMTQSEPVDEFPSSNYALLERASPQDWVPEENIKVYKHRVTFELPEYEFEWSTFTDTNSMDPVLDKGSHGIEVKPKSHEDIDVGDVVAYTSDYSDGVIIHRVVEKSYDREGPYFILKGDNNPSNDPGKVRFDQIQRVLIAVIY